MIIEKIKSLFSSKPKSEIDISELTGEIYPQSPRVKLIANKHMSAIYCDNGASFFAVKGGDFTKRTTDSLRNPHGCFCYIRYNGRVIPLTFAPDYKNGGREAAFSKNAVRYFAREPEIKATQKILLYPDSPCEQRKFTFENRAQTAITFTLLIKPPELVNSARGYFDKQKGIYEAKDDGNRLVMLTGDGFDLSNKLLTREITLKKGERTAFCVLTGCIKNEAELQKLQKLAEKPEINSHTAAGRLCDSPEADRLINQILARALFPIRDCGLQMNSTLENTHSKSALRLYGIKPELPLVAADIYSEMDTERVRIYAKCHHVLNNVFFPVQTVFVCHTLAKNGKNVIKNAVDKALELQKLKHENIKVVERSALPYAVVTALYAYSCHIAARSLVKIEAPHRKFTAALAPSSKSRHQTERTFSSNRLNTVVTNRSLGCTWYENSGKMYVTAPQEIFTRKNSPELLLLRIDGEDEIHDIIDGAVFSADEKAVFIKTIGQIDVKTTLQMENGLKRLDVAVKNRGKRAAVSVAYYIEPSFGAKPQEGRFVSGEKAENGLILTSSAAENKLYAAIGSGKISRICCDRASFLSGMWGVQSFYPLFDPCAAVISEKTADTDTTIRFSFFMTASDSRFAILESLHKLKPPKPNIRALR